MPSDPDPETVRIERPGGAVDPHSSAGVPRRLHPISPFLSLIASARQLVLPLVIIMSSGQNAGLTTLGVAILFPLMRTLGWFRHTYVIDDGVLRIESGIFRRTVRELRLERIQQVNLDRKLRHRIFGVVQVQVQTAGGTSGAEVDFDCVSEAEAARLQSVLMDARAAAAGPVEGPAAPARPLLALSTADAALAGMTQSRVPLLLTALAFGSQIVNDVVDAGLIEYRAARVPGVPQVSIVFAVAAGVIVVAILWFALGAIAGILQHHGFELVERDGELHTRRGLLTQREAMVPIKRVQVVRVDASPLRRMIGVSSVVVQSAGRTGDSNLLIVPLTRPRDVELILQIALPGVTTVPPLKRHPRAAFRRALARRLMLFAPLLAAGIAGVIVGAPMLLIPTVALVALALWWARAAYRGLGHSFQDGVVTTRHGATTRRTSIVPASKAQSLRLHTSPFQRRAGLAHLAIDVAGSDSPTIIDAGERDLDPLMTAILEARPRPGRPRRRRRPTEAIP